MPTPPSWFYRDTEPQIASYIGADGAALWVRSCFLYLVAWVLAAVGFCCLVLAETPGSPSVLWVVAGACWCGCIPFGWLSLIAGSAASRVASAYLSKTHGYRMRVSCPIASLRSQWERMVLRAEKEHTAHVQLARVVGVPKAIDQLVEERQEQRRTWWVVLGLLGFLGGFIVGVASAFLVGQTQSLGVFVVFLFAVFCSGAVPWLFRSRFRLAYERYRSELIDELTPAQLQPTPTPLQRG